MKIKKLLSVFEVLMVVLSVAACDNDTNSNAQDPGLGEEQPGPMATCPCFTQEEVNAAAALSNMPDGRLLQRVGTCLLASEYQSDNTTVFAVDCPDCMFGESNCMCTGSDSNETNLTADEFVACSNILVNTTQVTDQICELTP